MGVYFFLYPFDGEPFIAPVEELKGVYFSTPTLQLPPPPTPLPAKKVLRKEPIPYSRYLTAFERVQEEMKKGNTYLLNLTFPTRISTNYNLLQIYHATNALFKLYFRGEFVCFSPERFVKVEGNKISTFPMKGTIDATIPKAKELILNNPKEMAEHLMVVDLLRNDLGMVAREVRVEKFRYVEQIDAGGRPLLQVSSHISARLPDGWEKKWREWFPLLLPAGSISGTPKKRSCEIIREVEGYRRGYYTGVFGVVDEERKRLESGVIIRYVERGEGGELIYKSGGGITIDSDPIAEYRELLQKVYF
jgi:para-aminobenzoate synthetase component 1